MAAVDPASREAIANREVGHTDIAATTVGLLVISFLVAIAAVAMVEWPVAATLVATRRTPPVTSGASSWDRVLAHNRALLAWMTGFERGLEDRSRLGRTLRPPAQRMMTDRLGAGNERVYPGRAGWLFYRADVDYVTGAGFLESSRLERRAAAAAEWQEPLQPDPRQAIARFHEALAARGVTLIVVPTPIKASIHPEMLAARYLDAERPVQNRSFAAFTADLASRGVLVYDPAATLFAARRASAQYLAADTHWRPEAMELVAEGLAAFIAEHVQLPGVPDPAYRAERVEVRNVGDTARMLDLPPDQTLYRPERVWLRRVLLPDGSLWRSSREADVIVLGDSFSNIYSLASMGWGTSAGLVEQLSYALRRPIDRLVQNDDGAFATRAMLQRDTSRVAGKRVVVWQFAARELAFGDWRTVPHRP